MALSGFVGQPFEVDIVLDENPKGSATVQLIPATSGVVISPTTLSFDETNWSTPQQVTATLQFNPIKFGGVSNAVVVFTRTTTSWGGPDNVKKDRFRLNVLELEPDVFTPQGGVTGADPVFQKVGSIAISAANDGNLQYRYRITGPSFVRGSQSNSSLNVKGVHSGGTIGFGQGPGLGNVGSAGPWTTIPGGVSLLEVALMLKGHDALINQTPVPFDDSCSLGLVIETRVSGGTVLSTVPVGVAKLVTIKTAHIWAPFNDPGLVDEVEFDTEPVSVSFSASLPTTWQKTDVKFVEKSGHSGGTYWDMPWTQDGGTLSANGTVIPNSVGSSRTSPLSGALRIHVDYKGQFYPSGFSQFIHSMSTSVRAKTVPS